MTNDICHWSLVISHMSFKTPITAVTVIVPLPLPQQVFLDLSRGCFRKLLYKVDPPGTFKTRQPLAAVRVQGFCSQRRVGFKDYESLRYFAKTFMWTGDNGNFQHSRVCVDHTLDLESGNIFSARYDDVLGAILDFHITIGMEHGQIARMEPSSAECMLSGLGIPVVAFHDCISADDDFAD